MSKEFIQFEFPCKECLVRAACQEKPAKLSDLLEQMRTRCLSMPNYDDKNPKNSYSKTFLECWANIGWTAIGRIKSEDANKIPPKYIDFLIETIGLIQWIVNSSSWEDGTQHDFDLHEARRKANTAKGWLGYD